MCWAIDMTTRILEILHCIMGYALFLFTWELFLKRYFYTRSENEILIKNRGEGLFTITTLALMIVQICLFAAGCFLGTWFFYGL